MDKQLYVALDTRTWYILAACTW